ncbi:hypothetical protein [uncultured Dialister sp.]|uniref:hypothetical protein n=1 Tax=uncultured Dialister sp. TaxID=278064 RepID=UPI0026DAE566|nr:hypothetical protein [uncultured Dialister sp.]
MEQIDWVRLRENQERLRTVRLENGLFDALPESQADAVERRVKLMKKLKARKEKEHHGSRK